MISWWTGDYTRRCHAKWDSQTHELYSIFEL
jgi:hypothetical protein